jgi:hypothetical protein
MYYQSADPNGEELLKIFEVGKPIKHATGEPMRSFFLLGRAPEIYKRQISIRSRTIMVIAGLFIAAIIWLIWGGYFGATWVQIHQNNRQGYDVKSEIFGSTNKPGFVSPMASTDYQYTQNGRLSIVSHNQDSWGL